MERPGELAGFIVGGALRAKVGRAREVSKVSQALKNTEVNVKPIKGVIRETTIKALNLSPDIKAEVIKVLREGGAVKIYDIKGIAKKGFEKYTPNIKGKFIEVYDVRGNLINRYGAGGLKVTYKGKPIDIELYNQAVSLIEQSTGKIQGVSEVVTRQFKRGKVTKEERLRFLEDSEILLDIEGYLKKGDPSTKRRIVISQTQAKLLGKSKYLGEELLKEYKTKGRLKIIPDFEYLNKGAKPYIESISGEVYRPLSFEVSEGQVGTIGLFGTETRYGITGEAISRRVMKAKPKPKPSRAIPGFKDLYKKPKPSLSITEQGFINVVREIPGDIKGLFRRMKEPKVKQVVKAPKVKAYPTIVGGAGVESIWAGKQFPVPSGTEAAALAGISGIEAGTLVGRGFNLGGLIGGFGESISRDFVKGEQFSTSITDQRLEPTIVSDFSNVLVREKGKTRIVEGFGNLIAPVEVSRQAVTPAVRLLQPQILKQPQISKLVQRPRPPQPIPPGVGIVQIPIAIPPTVVIPFFFPGEKRKEEKRIGYHTEVKEKGKWKIVTDRPHTRQGAMDVGSRITDSTLSAQFRINPIMQTKQVKGRKLKEPKVFEERLKQGDGYFNVVARKFRDFIQRKGKRIKVKDRWIEKKQYRSDTRGESQGLTVAQIKGRQTRFSLGLPLRRTKQTKKKRFRL